MAALYIHSAYTHVGQIPSTNTIDFCTFSRQCSRVYKGVVVVLEHSQNITVVLKNSLPSLKASTKKISKNEYQ